MISNMINNMEFTVPYVSESRITTTELNTVCTGCLSTNRATASLSYGPHRLLYEDITNLKLKNDTSYALCCECSTLLYKYVKFRRKLIQCYTALQECYHSRAEDIVKITESLNKYRCPQFTRSNIFTVNAIETEVLGENLVLHNNKSWYEYIISTKEQLLTDNYHELDEEIPIVKTELEEYNEGKEEIGEESFFSEEFENVKVKCRRIRKEKKCVEDITSAVISDSQISTKSNHELTTKFKKRHLKLDPTKIRTIHLTETQQREHLQSRRAEPGFLKFPFKCEFCPAGFNFRKKLEDHMDLHDKNRGAYKCDICSTYLCNRSTYNCHMKKHSTMYECVACGKTGNTKRLMVEHYSLEHESSFTPYTCTICGKVYTSTKKHTIYLHIRQHKLEEKVQCDICKKIFNAKNRLQGHMYIHMDKPNAKTFVCPVCGHRTRTAKELEYHSVKHDDNKPHYCVECDRAFKTYATLRQHLETHSAHRDPDKLKYACPKCPRRYSWRRELTAHTDREHDRVKRHSCDACGKTFYGKQTLSAHIRYTHEGRAKLKKHKCEVCQKMFYNSSLLRQHSYVHSGERPYVCTECPAAFTQAGARMVHHRLVHLKLKRPANKKDT